MVSLAYDSADWLELEVDQSRLQSAKGWKAGGNDQALSCRTQYKSQYFGHSMLDLQNIF